MTQRGRVKIKGVRRKELDFDAISYVMFICAKAQVAEKRRREQEAKTARRSQQEDWR